MNALFKQNSVLNRSLLEETGTFISMEEIALN
jgi:hypothetical protein